MNEIAGTLRFALKLFHNVDHILDGTHRFEGVGLNFMASLLLQVNHHVNGINAVEIQIVVKARFRGDVLGATSNSVIRSAETS